MIVNYNVGRVLLDCLASVLPQVEEVVVVDNASEPEAFEPFIRAVESHPRLTVIRSNVNHGFAAGCNLGAEFSTQPLLMFLNPDCVVAPGAVAKMCAALQANPRAAVAGGLLTNTDGSEQGGGRRAVPTPWRSFVRAFGLARLSRRWPKLFDDFHLHYQPRPHAPLAVEAISGACMLVSRDAITELGLLDEGYFLHCEDLDFCMRARSAGWEILFVPDAAVVHFKGGCSLKRPIFVEWHKHKGMVRFYQKHFRQHYSVGLMQLVIVGVWLRFTVITARIAAGRLWSAAAASWQAGRRSTTGDRSASQFESAVMPSVASNRPLTS